MTIILATLLPATTKAEYRAFELGFEDTKTKAKRKTISTLDDIQYPTYHYVKNSELIKINSTWMCKTRADFDVEICPRPKEKPMAKQAPNPETKSGVETGLKSRSQLDRLRKPASLPK
jgi:hypothetical protein